MYSAKCGILPDQEWNLCLLHWQADFLPLSHQKSSNYDLWQVSFYGFSFFGDGLFFPQFSSVTQSCLTLRNPMNHSTPGLPVHHQLPEFTQTHVHWVGDAIQPPHPLLSPSPAFKLSQHQGLFQWVNSSHEVAKVWEFFPSSMFLFMKNFYYLTYCSKKFMNLRKKNLYGSPIYEISLISICIHILDVVFSLGAVNSSVPFLQRPTNIRQCLSVYFYSHLLFPNSLL